MISVGMNYSVIPGKDDEFTSVFAKVLEIMRKMDGHDKTKLYRDVWGEHDYLIISEWSDKAAFDAFISSERFKGVTDWGKKSILTGRPKHEIYGLEASGTAQAPAGCPAHSASD